MITSQYKVSQNESEQSNIFSERYKTFRKNVRLGCALALSRLLKRSSHYASLTTEICIFLIEMSVLEYDFVVLS